MKLKFNKYLTEANNDYYFEKIKKECKPYLSKIKNSEFMLVRDAGAGNKKSYKKKVRKHRRPMDTPLVVHEYLDKTLKDKFGWKPRSEGLFCFASNSDMLNVHYVFPIGKFKFVYSDYVDDATVYLADKSDNTVSGFSYNFEEEVDMAKIKNAWEKEALKTYKSTNFNKALELGNKDYEISIKCDAAYLIYGYATQNSMRKKLFD